jgi:hypothetical protein
MATPDYEIAFENWESEQAMESAFVTPAGQTIIEEVDRFMETLAYKEVVPNPLASDAACTNWKQGNR